VSLVALGLRAEADRAEHARSRRDQAQAAAARCGRRSAAACPAPRSGHGRAQGPAGDRAARPARESGALPSARPARPWRLGGVGLGLGPDRPPVRGRVRALAARRDAARVALAARAGTRAARPGARGGAAARGDAAAHPGRAARAQRADTPGRAGRRGAGGDAAVAARGAGAHPPGGRSADPRRRRPFEP
jgi:hypothetical protein